MGKGEARGEVVGVAEGVWGREFWGCCCGDTGSSF